MALSDMDTVEPLRSWVPVIAGGALSLAALWAGMRARRRKRLIDNLPTSRTQGVFLGFVELEGVAESHRPLKSFLAEVPCVYYAWSVEEHWSLEVTETHTDSDGKTHTTTRTESGWKTVAEGGEMIGFYLQDDTGVIRVLPEGARIEPLSVFDEGCEEGDPLYYEKGPEEAVSHSDYRRRFIEEAIPLRTAIYVVGQAREREDIVAPEIAYDAQAPMFLITTRTEKEVGSGLAWQSWGWWIFGLVLALAGVFIPSLLGGGAVGLGGTGLSVPQLPAAGAFYSLAWALGWAWMAYNSLVDLRQRARQAWSLVEVQLKRRNDLIPNLVACVTGIRDTEAALQRELAELRAQLSATPPGRPGLDHQACLPTIRTIAERYPEIKAQEAFLKLQEELSDTEQRIALARAYFNDMATFYNTRLEVVPDRFLARLGRMTPQTLMGAAGFERAPVTIDLAR